MKSLKIFIYLKICFMTAVSILYFNTQYADAVVSGPVEDVILQGLIDSAPSGSTVHLPRGEFYLGRPLEIPANKNLFLEGFAISDGAAGARSTKIRVHPNFFLPERKTANQALINVRGGLFQISRVGLIGTTPNNQIASCGIQLHGGDSIEISDTLFQSFNFQDSAAICGMVGKNFKLLRSMTINVFRSLDLTGSNQEISIIGGSLNGPGGSRLAGKIIVSDVDFEGGAGHKLPVITVITTVSQTTPSELKFERNYMELHPLNCDLTNFPQIVAIDIDGKGEIRDNQFNMKKTWGILKQTCSNLEGIIIKIRSPRLPLSLSFNNSNTHWNKVYWWDSDSASSPKISEISNNWRKPGALYLVGSGSSSFGLQGMRLNQQTGLKTVLQKIPLNISSLQLELTDSTVFEIETTKADQSVSVSRPPTTLTNTVDQKKWRIIHRIPGSIVVILNASISSNNLSLDSLDFKAGQALTPGKSRMFVVDQQGHLNPVGR